MSKIVDLSHVIEPGKAGRKFSVEMIGAETVNPNVIRLENQWYIMHDIIMVSHIATHIEAPYHILKDQADLAAMPLETLMGPAIILDLRGRPAKSAIGIDDVKTAAGKAGGIRKGDIVFANLGFGPFYGTERYGGTPYFPPETIAWLADQGMKLLGVDAGGVEVPGSEQHVSHYALFSRGIPLIENVANLDRLSKPRVQAYAFPIAVHGLEAFPVRVVAVEED